MPETLDHRGSLLKELNFYQRLVSELSGDQLRLDYLISGLRHELKQKRLGFTLLSSLQQSLGSKQDLHAILETTVDAIAQTLGMDTTIAFVPVKKSTRFRPLKLLAAKADQTNLVDLSIQFPSEIISENNTLIVNKATEPTAFTQKIRDEFNLPYFVAVPILTDGQLLAVLVSGRRHEAKPLYPPLNKGDIDTFQAIASLVSDTLRNKKIQKLEEADRLKTEFFANLSHEFRTPITLTIGPLETMLSGHHGDLAPQVVDEIRMMMKNQMRLLNLVNQILDFEKFEYGSRHLRATRTHQINLFVKSRIEQFGPLAQKRGIQLKTKFDPKVEVSEIYLDIEKMDKVLFNLLSNACKFTHKGSITVQTKIHDEHFILSVKDTGIGIRPGQEQNIFDRFKQANGSSSSEFSGTGIGLALTKQIVELHGGEINVQSVFGAGSVFTMSIPLGCSHLPSEAVTDEDRDLQLPGVTTTLAEFVDERGSNEEYHELEKMNQETLQNLKPAPTILYVDDSRDMRKFIHFTMSREFNVILGLNGLDGLKKVRQYPIDLIISDLMMPILSGTEFLRKAKKDLAIRHIPFMLLTARTSLLALDEELEAGLAGYMTKPFSIKDLSLRIRNLIASEKTQRRSH